MMRRRGLWAEMLSADALRDPATHRLLSRFGCEVAIAVRPGDLDHAGAALRVARAHGVRAAVWPMLDDADGRWLSAANASVFVPFAREVLAASGAADLVLDLEPPYARVRGALDGERRAVRDLVEPVFRPSTLAPGKELIRDLCAGAAQGGVRVMAAVAPLLLLDRHDEGPFGRACGAPPAEVESVNAMLYSTLFSGYSRGWLGREDARALVALGARRAVRRWGERAHVSLGAVGVGALGDEAVYEDPALLADDAALAEAAGARALWLLDLGGVLHRGAPERWLDAFTAPAGPVRPPRPSLRTRSALLLLSAFGAIAAG